MGATISTVLPAPRKTLSDDATQPDLPVFADLADFEASAKPASPLASPLNDMLRSLAKEVATAHSRSVRMAIRGLEHVPAHYTGVVKDICIQMIRNSIVHGFESAAERRAHGKTEEGTLQISFSGDSVEDYLLMIEDDGRGLNYEQIIDKALRAGLVSPQQAVGLDRTLAHRLIFQPGFSTAEDVSEHAGRGVGLDAVSNLVRESGGKIGVSTVAGQYTRFKVLLPKAVASPASASSAA
jgi:two-component system chemotaxis sensor kinase CheA